MSHSSSSSSSSRPQWKKRVNPATDAESASASASASVSVSADADASESGPLEKHRDESYDGSSSRGRGRGRGRGRCQGRSRRGGGRGGATAYVPVSHDDNKPSQHHQDEIKQSQHDHDHDDHHHHHYHHHQQQQQQQQDGTSSARRRNRSRNIRGRGRGGVTQSHPSSDAPYAHIHDATNNPITSSLPPSKVTSESTPSRSRPQQRIRPRVTLPSSASQLTSSLTEHLLAGTYDCSICSEPIKRHGGIWSCQRCYMIVHQKCIKKWWKTKMDQSGSKLLGEQSWHCPGCLFVHVDPPAEYTCWCGKITDPEPNPYLLPHSCGNICSRSRGPDCPHPCNELCHPGTCAPCPAMGPLRTCPCGRMDYRLRCGEVEKSRRTCDAICDRPLSCGSHRCQRTCHEDICGTCHITEEQTCFCGKETSQRPCGSGTIVDGVKRFACTNVCGKKLSCGNHTCTQPCHAGACTPCSRIPITPQPCACGSSFPTTSPPRTSCLSPLPTCTSRCNRLLSCGQHICQQLCHDSPCRPCTAIVKRTCRCMQSVINIPCMELKKGGAEDVDENGNLINEIRCGRVCKVKLACGRHICNERCCSSEINPSHLCLRVCGKPSPCGVPDHTCDRFCHLGPCPPCAVTFRDGITCRCGAARIPGPVTCGTEPPHCNKPCSVPRSCGHACAYTCHQKECPPCAVLTTRVCSGGHRELKNIPCYAATVSCGIICKKPLPCGQHTCKRVCHGGECMPTTTTSNESKEAKTYASLSKPSTSNGGCTQKCGEKRFDCEHTCKALCHPNKPCPDIRCDELVTVYCACRRIHRDVICGMGGGNRIPPAQLECDDQCEVEARNARFRQALAVEDRPHIPYPTVLLEHLLNLDVGKYAPKMEQILADFLAKPLSMSQPTKTLPPMPGDQRWLLHQMASYYGIDSESFDAEPRRSVRLIRSRTSAVPSMLLSQAIRLYIPYRRDPTQSNAIDISQPSRILHFYHLDTHPAISPSDLRLCLKPWEGHFRINWLDHTHAFVTFDDATRCAQAREILSKKGVFKFEEEVKPGSTKLERALTIPGDTTSSTTTLTSSSTSTSTSTTTSKPAITDFAASFYAAGAGDVSSSSSSTSTSSSTVSSTSPSVASTPAASASISPYIAAYKPPTEFQPVKSRTKQRTRVTSAPKRDAWDEDNESVPVKSTWEDEDEEEPVRDTSGSWRKPESTSTSTSAPATTAPSNSKKAAPKPSAGNMFAAFDSDED